MEVLSQLENEFEKWFLEIINFEDKKNVILNLKNSFNILEKIYEEINEEKKNNDFNFYIINTNSLQMSEQWCRDILEYFIKKLPFNTVCVKKITNQLNWKLN